MKRRSFLGIATGAVFSGPKVMAEAASQMEALNIPRGIATAEKSYVLNKSTEADAPYPMTYDPIRDAKQRLAWLLGKSKEQIEWEKSELYISSLDPDVVSLRSITLASKIRMQRDRVYERRRREEINSCHNIINRIVGVATNVG